MKMNNVCRLLTKGVLSLSCLGFLFPQDDTGIVQNGGFENDFEQWFAAGKNDITDGNVCISEESRSGGKCLQINGDIDYPNNGWLIISQDIDLLPEQDYTVSFFIKTMNITQKTNEKGKLKEIKIAVREMDEAGKSLTYCYVPLNEFKENSWLNIKKQFKTLAAGRKYQVMIYAISLDDGDVVFVDDIAVTKAVVKAVQCRHIDRELPNDPHTLFLAHFNTSYDAEYAKGNKNAVGGSGKLSKDAVRGRALLAHGPGFSPLTYAAADNVSGKAGTIEFMYKPYFSHNKPDALTTYTLWFSGNTEKSSSLGINVSSGKYSLWVIVSDAEQKKKSQLFKQVDFITNTWYHIAFSWDTEALCLYVDGLLSGRVEKDYTMPFGTYFLIGGRPSPNYADGVIDEFRISDIARDVLEIPSILVSAVKENPKKLSSAMMPEAKPMPRVKTTILPLEFQVLPGEFSTNKSTKEVLDTLRMSVFAYGKITEEEADNEMRKMRDSGFNAVLTEGQRYLLNDKPINAKGWDFFRSLPFEENIRCTKIVADACHKYGLKVFLHLTGTAIPDDEFAQAHPNWMSVRLTDGKVSTKSGIHWACFNNNDFAEAYLVRLAQLIKGTGADGLMVDELNCESDHCGCGACRSKFKKVTGYDMPEKGAAWMKDLNTPEYQSFLTWRLTNMITVAARVREVLRTYSKDGILLTYYAYPHGENAWASHGISVDILPDLGNIVGWETCAWTQDKKKKTWPMFIANMKATRAAGEISSGNLFIIDYSANYPDYYMFWLLGLSQGMHKYWSRGDRAELIELRTPLVHWEMKNENFFAGLRSSADTAVLLSTRNNNLSTMPGGVINRQNSFFAVCNTLTLAGIPFRVILDRDIQSLSLTNKAKTLIMLNIGLLSDKETEVIRQFVRGGGVLIASANTSLFDETGKRRSDFSLADVLGCNYLRHCLNDEGVLSIKEKILCIGNVHGEIRHPDYFVEVSARSSTRVFGSLENMEGHEVPGLLMNSFGKGQAVYFACEYPVIFLNRHNIPPTLYRTRVFTLAG